MRYGKTLLVMLTLMLIIMWGVQADAKGRKVVIPAPVPQTGENTTYSPGDDGTLQKGVAWPVPRFTDQGDGTIRDNLTGLIWLKNANCFGPKTWFGALNACNLLQDGDCELEDGSLPGDWRLPNVRELFSLVHFGVDNPAIPNTMGTGKLSDGDPFTGLECDRTDCSEGNYWTSNREPVSEWAYYLYLGAAFVKHTDPNNIANAFHVWPVRGGK
jgi:hypothetical protein